MKKISLYCNWNIFIDSEGNRWLPSVHARYIYALKNLGFKEITLTSKISPYKTNEHDHSFIEKELNIIPIPFFTSYLYSIFKLPSIVFSFYKQAKLKTDYCYIRTYEPFIWILVLIQRLLSPKTKLFMHYISDPKSAIFSNAKSSYVKKLLRYFLFLPEYYLTNLSALFCNLSSNGPVPIKNTPFFIRNRISEVIESAMLESDLLLASNKNFNNKKTNNNISILYVGYIRPSKGINVLIDAIELLSKDGFINFKVTVVGDGEYLDKIKETVLEKNIAHYFSFTGYIPFSKSLFYHYLNSDIFINLSPSETGPRVLLEAGIFGCQLISTKVGYAEEILQGKGFLIDSNSSIQAKNAIQNAIKVINENRKNNLGKNINSSLFKYTAENFFRNVLKINKI